MIPLANDSDAEQVFQSLLQRGVIVRPLVATGLPACLRVSVGTPEENECFIRALQEVRQEMESLSYASVD
jgi:histidinol-phosphate aminotransferase